MLLEYTTSSRPLYPVPDFSHSSRPQDNEGGVAKAVGQLKEVNVAEAVKDVGKGKEVERVKKGGRALVRGMRTRVELASWVVVFSVSGLTHDEKAILKLSTVRQSQLDELNKELFNCEAQYKQGVAKPRSSMRCLMKLAPKARNPLWKVEPKHKKSVISESRSSPETRF